MPTELEELLEFLHHGNVQIRQAACEHLVGYSLEQKSIFKVPDFTPVKDLKLLIRDHDPIAKNALTILINLSADPVILEDLAKDDEFVKSVLTRVTDPENTNATLLCMLISNLSKHESFQRILDRRLPERKSLKDKSVPLPSDNAIDHLMTVFLLGEGKQYNPDCTYAYLSWAFAELARHEPARKFFTTPVGADDGEIPLSKVLVFTEHKDEIRRRGAANVIKNVCFEVDAHPQLFAANVLPYLLLPLMGDEEYPDDEADKMPEELQLLPPDKKRERDVEILKTHIDSLLLLSTSKGGRDLLKQNSVYPIIRECHLAMDDEDVRDACDRFVQVILRDDEPEDGADGAKALEAVQEEEDDDEDMQIVEV